MICMNFTPRQLVALYLHLAQNEQGVLPELSGIEELLSRKLCEYLSIAQFEQLQSLYEADYRFDEITTDEVL